MDPARRVRPVWWTDETYRHLSLLNDEILPCGNFFEADQDPELGALKYLMVCLWDLGQTGSSDEHHVLEYVREAQYAAWMAAEQLRGVLSMLTDRAEDDDYLLVEREAMDADAPGVRLTEAQFSVRLPGYADDTVTGRITVNHEGAMTLTGGGPLADPDFAGRLDARSVAMAIERLLLRQLDRPVVLESDDLA